MFQQFLTQKNKNSNNGWVVIRNNKHSHKTNKKIIPNLAIFL